MQQVIVGHARKSACRASTPLDTFQNVPAHTICICRATRNAAQDTELHGDMLHIWVCADAKGQPGPG